MEHKEFFQIAIHELEIVKKEMECVYQNEVFKYIQKIII